MGLRRGPLALGLSLMKSLLCSIYPAGYGAPHSARTATWQGRAQQHEDAGRLGLNEFSSDPSHAAGLFSRRGARFSGFTVAFGCKTAKRGS